MSGVGSGVLETEMAGLVLSEGGGGGGRFFGGVLLFALPSRTLEMDSQKQQINKSINKKTNASGRIGSGPGCASGASCFGGGAASKSTPASPSQK